MRVGISTRARHWVRFVRGTLAHAREVALEPTDHGLRFRPGAFVRSARTHLLERLRRPEPVLPPFPERVPTTGRRVLHVIDSITVGGSQKIIFDIVRGLGDRWAMHIATCAVGQGHYGTSIAVTPDRAAFERLVGELRPDLVHVHYWGRTPWMDMALEVLTQLEPRPPILQNANNPIPIWSHPAVSHVAYVSDFVRALQPIPAPHSSVVYPGVDLSEYAPLPDLPDAETVGLVYRLCDDKLTRDTIEVLIALARRRPRARIIICGDGKHFVHYVTRTHEAGVRHQFHFTGRVPFTGLAAYYDRMSLFLAPVHTESYGVVVPYALAKNIPIAGYRVGALSELLGDDSTLADSPEALVDIAAGLLDDYARRRALGIRGRERAMRHFSLEAMLTQYADLYSELIG